MNVFEPELDKKVVEDRRKKLEDRERSDLFKTVASSEGRRFVHKLIRASGFLEGPLTPMSSDQEMTAYRLGQWGMGKALFMLLWKECPETLLVMQREFTNDQLQAEIERRQSHGE